MGRRNKNATTTPQSTAGVPISELLGCAVFVAVPEKTKRWKGGHRVTVGTTTTLWDGHYWGRCIVKSVTDCARYAIIEGQIAWGTKPHRTTILTAYLRPVREQPNAGDKVLSLIH